MPAPYADITGSLVHTQERFRVIIQSYTSINAASTVAPFALTGLLASEVVLAITAARAEDVLVRQYGTITRGLDNTVGFTTVGAVTGTPVINLSYLVFRPSSAA